MTAPEGLYVTAAPVQNPYAANVNCHPMTYSLGNGNPYFDKTPPSAPSNLVSTGKTATSVALSWTGSTDNVAVDRYKIYNGSTYLGATKNTTSNVSGLTTATAYNFAVSAVDINGNESTKSNVLAVTTN